LGDGPPPKAPARISKKVKNTSPLGSGVCQERKQNLREVRGTDALGYPVPNRGKGNSPPKTHQKKREHPDDP